MRDAGGAAPALPVWRAIRGLLPLPPIDAAPFSTSIAVDARWIGERGWEVGLTVVAATTGARHQVNLISAVTPVACCACPIDGRLNAAKFIGFCHKLLYDTPGPVFLVIDSHPVHRSSAVKQFAASMKGRLRLCFLPAYPRRSTLMTRCGRKHHAPGSPATKTYGVCV